MEIRIVKLVALTLSLAAPPVLNAQAPAPPTTSSRRIDAGFVVGGDWLQASALPLDRDALPSNSIDLAWRRNGWSYSAGFMRVARDLNTVQGGTLGVGRLFSLGPVLFIPSIGILAGQTYASVDSTGYDFIDADGVPGHMPRYSYSDGFSFGGGVNLTIEYPVYRGLGLRVVAGEWFFSGSPLANSRPRTILGGGLSLRVKR